MAKKGFRKDVAAETLKNNNFRKVLYTGEHLQLVLMTLKPGEEIGEETHPDRDQFFRFEQGEGVVMIDGKKNKVEDDFGVIVPAGAKHNVINTGKEPLKMYTIYGPPEHKDKTIHKTKAIAEKNEEEDHFDGKTTE
ncbi:cupin domain-containing protein [Sphingomonas sp.]|jgi:mannose-6-phosphate isomerase-like protein (cupin superfamily)|uniref:cupin domain-containing protein n=1 Tax=Sphingomonas sp. TaxID=28214 RepID=UPI002DE24CBB|nr:cupin domain-containing protein [Sphingomonas sp.]